MTVRAAGFDSREFFRTPPRGYIRTDTNEWFVPDPDGRKGGPPYRGESDAEYESRCALYEAGIQSLTEPQSLSPVPPSKPEE